MLSEALFARRFLYHLRYFSRLVLRRNLVGEMRGPKGDQTYSVGFGKGSSDYIGYRKVVIDQKMVGQTIAQFVGVELKSEKGKLRPEQKEFLSQIAKDGGVAIVARPQNYLELLQVIEAGEHMDNLRVEEFHPPGNDLLVDEGIGGKTRGKVSKVVNR